MELKSNYLGEHDNARVEGVACDTWEGRQMGRCEWEDILDRAKESW